MVDIYKPERASFSVTVPSLDPVVDADFVELHTNLTGVDALSLMAQYIDEATELVARQLNRVLLASTCVLKLDHFPSFPDAVIELPGGKVQSVTSIAYIDSAGAAQTWAAENWVADLSDDYGNARIGLALDEDWPTTAGRGLCVTITYQAGWGAAADVPAIIRGAISKVAASLYDERHAETAAGLQESRWFRAFISTWRVWKVA